MLTEAFREMPRSKSVGADGYILSNEGALKCARWLLREIKVPDYESSDDTEDDTDSDDENDDDNDQSVIRIPQDKVKYVIGKDGNTIRELQTESNTMLKKYVFRERGREATFLLIKGDRLDRKKAKDAIMKVVNENDEDNCKICCFYEQGDCRSGSQCRFYHDNANTKSKKSKMH